MASRRRQRAASRTRPQDELLICVMDPSPGRGWRFALAGMISLWTFLLCCTPMKNTDIWWHLRTGQLIIERGKLPFADWFTFTEPESLWIDLHWGFQLFVTALYSLGEATFGGVELLVLTKAFCMAAAVAIGWSAAGNRLPGWAKTACWVMPVICISGRSPVRPEMLSMILLAAWLGVVGRLDRRPRLIWWLPVLQLVWVNCQALFVLGLVVAVLYGIDRVARLIAAGRWGLEPADEAPWNVVLFRAGLLIGLACFINPYFDAGALFPLELYRKFSVDHEFYSKTIGEFRPPLYFYRESGLANLSLAAELGVWVTTAASFVWLARERRANIFRLLLFAAFSHLAWKMARNTNIFSLVSGVLLCANLSDALILRRRRLGYPLPSNALPQTADSKASAGFAGVDSDTSETRVNSRLNLGMLVVVAALAVSHLSGHWESWTDRRKPFGLGEAKGWYAHAASKFAGKFAGQKEFPKRAIVANFGQAAVYSFHNAPRYRVFMDGRLEVCSRETFELYRYILDSMVLVDRHWEQLPQLKDQHGNLPAVILDSQTSLKEIRGMYQNPGWRLVFADEAAAVYIEKRLADRLKLQLADPEQIPGIRLNKASK